ncbi:MAG: hypothetical protein ACOCXT_00790 [Candidatus Dojkabacteria bacterium]
MSNTSTRLFTRTHLILGILGIGMMFIFSAGMLCRSQASPQKVQISTVGSNTFTVSFLTNWSTPAEIEVADNPDFRDSELFLDERDYFLDGTRDKKSSRRAHLIVARNLEPNTKYYFKINTLFNQKDIPDLFQLETPKVDKEIKTPEPAYGEILDKNNHPQENILVQLQAIAGEERISSLLTTYTADNGTYSFDLANLRSLDHKEPFEPSTTAPTKYRITAYDQDKSYFIDAYDQELTPVQSFSFQGIQESDESSLQKLVPETVAAEKFIKTKDRAYDYCANQDEAGGTLEAGLCGEIAEEAMKKHQEGVGCQILQDHTYGFCADVKQQNPEKCGYIARGVKSQCEADTGTVDSGPKNDEQIDSGPINDKKNACELLDTAYSEAPTCEERQKAKNDYDRGDALGGPDNGCAAIARGGKLLEPEQCTGPIPESTPKKQGDPAQKTESQKAGCKDTRIDGNQACQRTLNGQETGEPETGKVCSSEQNTCVTAPQPVVEGITSSAPTKAYECSRGHDHNVAICCGNKYNPDLPWDNQDKGRCPSESTYAACIEEANTSCTPSDSRPAPEPRPTPPQDSSPPEKRPTPQPNPDPGSEPNPIPPQPAPEPPSVNIPLPPELAGDAANSQFESIRKVNQEYRPVEGEPIGVFKMDLGKWKGSWAEGNVMMAFCGMNANLQSCYQGTPQARRGIGGAHVIVPGDKFEFNHILGNVSPGEFYQKIGAYPEFTYNRGRVLNGICELSTTVRVAAHRAGLHEREFTSRDQVDTVRSFGTGTGYDGDIKHWTHSPVIDGVAMDFNKVAVNGDTIDPKMYVSIVELQNHPLNYLNDGDLEILNTTPPEDGMDLILTVDFEDPGRNIIVAKAFFARKVQNTGAIKKNETGNTGILSKAHAESGINATSGQILTPGQYTGPEGVTLNIESPTRVNFYLDLNGNGKQDSNERTIVDQNFTLRKEQKTFRYDFVNGWNLANFPFFNAQSELYKASDLISIAKSKNVPITSVKKWHGKWIEYTDDNGKIMGSDFAIKPNEGYFIRAQAKGYIEFFGSTPQEPYPVQLLNGWSLVGVAPGTGNGQQEFYGTESFKDGIQAFEFLKVIESAHDGEIRASNLTRYDNGVYRGVNYTGETKEKRKEFGLDFKLKSTEAYFIKTDKKTVFSP